MSAKIFIVLFCVFCYINIVNGACFIGMIKAEMSITQRPRFYCEYKAKPTSNDVIKLLPGSTFYTESCLECKCSMDGLQCCGFGHVGGVVKLPPDCTMLRDGCQPLYVKKTNQSLDCHTGQPILLENLAPIHPDNMLGQKQDLPPIRRMITASKTQPITVPARPKWVMPINQAMPRPDWINRRSQASFWDPLSNWNYAGEFYPSQTTSGDIWLLYNHL